MKTYEDFLETLKKGGYKLTTPRKIVFKALYANQNKHKTVEELYEYIKKEHPKFAIATVYRNIQLLSETGIINKINLDDGLTRYELAKDNDKHTHHHLICTNCEKVIEVEEDLMDSVEKTFDANYGFFVTDHQTKFYGLCEDCRKEKSTIDL